MSAEYLDSHHQLEEMGLKAVKLVHLIAHEIAKKNRMLKNLRAHKTVKYISKYDLLEKKARELIGIVVYEQRVARNIEDSEDWCIDAVLLLTKKIDDIHVVTKDARKICAIHASCTKALYLLKKHIYSYLNTTVTSGRFGPNSRLRSLAVLPREKLDKNHKLSSECFDIQRIYNGFERITNVTQMYEKNLGITVCPRMMSLETGIPTKSIETYLDLFYNDLANINISKNIIKIERENPKTLRDVLYLIEKTTDHKILYDIFIERVFGYPVDKPYDTNSDQYVLFANLIERMFNINSFVVCI